MDGTPAKPSQTSPDSARSALTRSATVDRATRETRISATVDLDSIGRSDIRTGVGFLDHMLDQLARHGLFDLTFRAEGDLHIDFHHTTEDVGITLGLAFAKALGDRRGIQRYGEAHVPMDEALSFSLEGAGGRHQIRDFRRGSVGQCSLNC